MLRSFLLVLALLAVESLHAQCNSRLDEQIKLPNGQRIISKQQTLVVRGAYAYSIELSASDKGVQATFHSRGGEKPNKDDELIFIDKAGNIKAFRFVGSVKTGSIGGKPEFSNILQLDYPSAQWLADNDIPVVSLKNNIKGQGRRFTLPASRQAEFRQLARCFVDAVDETALPNIAAVTKSIPAVRRAQAPPVDREGGLSAKPGTATLADRDRAAQEAAAAEIKDLRAQLAALKKQLLEEIAIEKAKADRAKETIADDLSASRQAAALQQQAIAAEVVEARQRADQAIAEAQAAAGQEIQEVDADVDEERQAAANEVAQARQAALLAIEQAKTDGARQVAEIKKRNAEAAAAERQKFADAKQDYADEVASARETSQQQIIEIRRELEAEIKRARAAALVATDSTRARVAYTRAEAQREILLAKEQSLTQVAELREQVAREQEARAIQVAETKRRQAEALAEQDDNQALKEKFSTVAAELAAKESVILQELLDAQGDAVDIDGYYYPEESLVNKAMRPSETLNKILADI